jgi:site-specific DNA-methyltransferase (adenine-specific)
MMPDDHKAAECELVPVERLRPWMKNPRRNDRAVHEVAASIKRFGFGAPIIARRENMQIIAGHTRLKAAIELGLTEVPVRLLDLSESDAKRLSLADNRLGEIAEWDREMLDDLLIELREEDIDGDPFLGMGFEDDDVGNLDGPVASGDIDDARIFTFRVPKSQAGDVDGAFARMRERLGKKATEEDVFVALCRAASGGSAK